MLLLVDIDDILMIKLLIIYRVYLAIILCIGGNIEIRDFKSLFSNDNCMISITDLFDMPIKPCNSTKI